MRVLVSQSAIPLSQVRKVLTKNWDKRRYANVFKKFGEPRGFRIYLELGKLTVDRKVRVPNQIASYLKSKGFELQDYGKGIVLDKHRRPMRLGKVLSKNPELKKIFDNDKQRSNVTLDENEDLLVVISRHPYDIAGMSTGRGWTSCMNLDGGINSRYIPKEIKVGSLIAYLIRPNDKDIGSPIARCLIKPFLDEDRKKFLVADKSYPYGFNKFQQFVQRWVDKHLNGDSGILAGSLNEESYNDRNREAVVGLGDVETVRARLKSDPEYSRKFNNILNHSTLSHAMFRSNPDLIELVGGDGRYHFASSAIEAGLSFAKIEELGLLDKLTRSEWVQLLQDRPELIEIHNFDLDTDRGWSKYIGVLERSVEPIALVDLSDFEFNTRVELIEAFITQTDNPKKIPALVAKHPDVMEEITLSEKGYAKVANFFYAEKDEKAIRDFAIDTGIHQVSNDRHALDVIFKAFKTPSRFARTLVTPNFEKRPAALVRKNITFDIFRNHQEFGVEVIRIKPQLVRGITQERLATNDLFPTETFKFLKKCYEANPKIVEYVQWIVNTDELANEFYEKVVGSYLPFFESRYIADFAQDILIETFHEHLGEGVAPKTKAFDTIYSSQAEDLALEVGEKIEGLTDDWKRYLISIGIYQHKSLLEFIKEYPETINLIPEGSNFGGEEFVDYFAERMNVDKDTLDTLIGLVERFEF